MNNKNPAAMVYNITTWEKLTETFLKVPLGTDFSAQLTPQTHAAAAGQDCD